MIDYRQSFLENLLKNGTLFKMIVFLSREKKGGFLQQNEPEIVFSNRDVVLLNKAVGMDSEHALGEGFYPIYRLDKVASGLLLYAKNESAARKLSAALQEGKVEKRYRILIPSENANGEKFLEKYTGEGHFQNFLYKDSQKQKMFPVKKPRKGVKEASLRYKVLKERDGLLLLEIALETGRFHQIRAQFSAHGFPLLGDGKYGSRRKGNVALHCYSLSFPDPESGKELHFQAEKNFIF